MEWVETTGKTVDEATDRALAHLGVHRDDAEVEVIEEPKAGMFGRVRGEARVRARVRPSGPRPEEVASLRAERRTVHGTAGRSERPRAESRDGGEPREPRHEKERAPSAATATKATKN